LLLTPLLLLLTPLLLFSNLPDYSLQGEEIKEK
jgi:hypothetical protein